MMIGKGKFLLVIGIDLENTPSAANVEIELNKIRKELNAKNSSIYSIYFDVRDYQLETV
jgi:hypothetical protein